jgi:hypothetical protein
MTNDDTFYTGFDVEELRQVARVLTIINPTYHGADPVDIMHGIVEFARRHLPVGEHGYAGTSGFYVTAYHLYGQPTEAWSYKVTLAAITVNSYINDVMERLHKVTDTLGGNQS